MAKKEKKKLEKKNWSNTFTLTGEAKINDYTFKIDEKSEKSNWVYNSLNLGVFCGDKNGTIYSELMGGYGIDRDNLIYVHGKTEDGKDDFDNRFEIDWDDRNDEEILKTIGDMCFLTVALELDTKGKPFYKKFLSAYDAIAYIKEVLTDGMIITVTGTLKYSSYNDNTQCKKEISRITLSKADDVSKYRAVFTQTMLLNKDSKGKIDKETGILPINAKVLDYVKEWKGKEVKTFVPYNKTFEYEVDMTNPERTKKAVDKLFTVSKGVTEITFEGEFIEGGAVVTATEDDLPDDVKELIDLGVYTLDEALAKCTVNSGRERRMVIRKPLIKIVELEGGEKVPKIMKTEKKYEDEDLILDFMLEKDDPEVDDDDYPFPDNDDDSSDSDSSDSGNDDSWLDNL